MKFFKFLKSNRKNKESSTRAEGSLDCTQPNIIAGEKLDSHEVCSLCNKPVLSYFDIHAIVLVMTQGEYDSHLDNSDGIYCANCDRNVCITCLSSRNSIADIEVKNERGRLHRNALLAVDDWNRNNPRDVKKYVIFKCPTCKTFHNEFPEHVENCVLAICDKKEGCTLEELGGAIEKVNTLVSRLEKRSLLKEWVDTQRKILESMIRTWALPKIQNLIQVHLEESRFDDGLTLCNLGMQWSTMLKEKGDLPQKFEELKKDMEKLKSPTLEISVEGLKAAFEKERKRRGL